MSVQEVLGWMAGAYVILTYLAHKLFPHAENISASDPRYTRNYDSTASQHMP